MDELINKMNAFLANSYAFYLKAHFYHWNVQGSDFPMYHTFLGDLYEEVYDSVDDIAEHIRQLDGIPQNSPSMLKQNSELGEATKVKTSSEIFAELNTDVLKLISDTIELNRMSDRFSKIGLSNYIQDRNAAFEKHHWMIKSIIARVPE